MKKLFLLIAVVAMALPSCKKINDELDALGTRLDKLEQETIPTIDEQIESINAQLKSLKATDEAIKKQISELEKSDEATAAEIADLKKKDSALEKSISDLQNYVDTQIANAKNEAAAAYATVEQYNTIVAQLNALQNSTNKLGEDLTAKINAEVKSLTDKIAELEARLKAVEDKVENLLARIQSVSYIPTYSDGKATVKYAGNISRVTLDFEISPKDAVAELVNVWEEALSVKAIYTQTRAVSFVDMPIIAFGTDTQNGVISVTVSGENLSAEFFSGTQEASVALTISDGNNSVTSDYIPMVAAEKIDNEIWYTSINDNIVEPNATDAFGANIVSNTCEYKLGIITFDAPVTSIGGDAFYNCTSLTSVTIPDSVTSIEWAFRGCTSLTSITIGNGVTSIGMSAFSGCTSLTSITIPDSVTSIGHDAFRNCSSLTSITIPNSVTSIGSSAFARCSSLKSFYGKFASEDNRCLIVDGVLKSFAIGCGATEYTIPDSVTSIGNDAFAYCTPLTSITIPDSVTSIGAGAFAGCSPLTSITIPDSVTSIGGSAFAGCTSLASVSIGNSVTSIGAGAFFNCTSLTSVTIPDSVTEIGVQAFSGCSALTSINIPKRVGYIGRQAFAGCTGTLLLDSNIIETDYSASPFDNSQSWLYGSQFTELIVGSSITTIGDFAFASCGSLTSVTISDGVTAIGEKAFHYCTKLTSITIPESVVSIGTDAMDACYNLTSLYGPLASEDHRCIIIDGELVVFAEAGLTSYSIPDSVTTIGFYVFDHCTNLTSITIPKSVTLIKESAFTGCSALIEVNCMPTTAPKLCNPYTFKNNASGRKIYVPRNSVEAYKAASGWSDYASDIEGYDF